MSKNATTNDVGKFTEERAMIPTACWCGGALWEPAGAYGDGLPTPRSVSFLLLNQLFHTHLHTLILTQTFFLMLTFVSMLTNLSSEQKPKASWCDYSSIC